MITFPIKESRSNASLEKHLGSKLSLDVSLSLLIVQVLALFCLDRFVMRKILATKELIILTPNLIVSLHFDFLSIQCTLF